uniref:Uncharacterized protein n=1 Tax=Arundo donax TaxID=35708 RepID=A0A0A9FYG7_ARUDO
MRGAGEAVRVLASWAAGGIRM